MELTYSQLVDLLVSAGDLNATFASARYGEPSEVTEPSDVRYPCWFVEQDPLVTGGPQTVTYSFACQALDRIPEGLETRKAALDRMEFGYQTALRWIELNHPELTLSSEGPEFTAVTLMEAYPDRVVGWRVEFTLTTERLKAVCDLPYA